MKYRLATALVLVSLLSCPPVVADEAIDLDAKLPVDPALQVVGGLPNGMSYWIRPHAVPKGKVTLMLHVSSGSLQEEENQRGLAHFLEHMAFNGSKHFPPGEVVKFFESMGMRFGQHQNAFTSFDQTTYMLSLPDTETATLERGLLFFSDVADALLITEAEVEKERGVIAEEKRSRSGAQMRMMEQVLPMLLPGSRIAERLPIGTDEVIQGAPPERLRAYYEKWYRPDLTTLLVVGDVDAKTVEPLVKKAFSGWACPETPADVVDPGLKPFETTGFGVVTDPEQNEAEVSLTFIREDAPLATVGDYRKNLVERLAVGIVNRRLATRVQEDEAAYVRATIQRGMALSGYQMPSVDATAEPGDWKAALTEVVAEIRRAEKHGFLPREVTQARKIMAAQLDQMSQMMAMLPSQSLGQILNRNHLTRGRKPMSPEQHQALAAQLLPGIEADELKAALKGLLPLEKAFTVVTFPADHATKAPTEAEVEKAWTEANAADVAVITDRGAVDSILDKAPRPGAVASTETHEGLGITTLTLENGVVVHVKPMDDVETVTINASFFGGTVEETKETRGLTNAAAVALQPSRMATARLSPSQVTEYLAAKKVRVGGGASDIAIELGVSGAAQDLEDGMQLAWLLMTEPKVDATALDAWKRDQKVALDGIAESAQAQGMLGLRDLASSGDPRLGVLSAERVDAITVDAAQQWLDRVLIDAPVEVAIAGKIDVAEATSLAKRWFGALAKRKDRFEALRALRKVKSFEGPAVKTIEVPTVTPMAFVVLWWRGVAPDEHEAQIAITHASSMLSSRLIDSVREERGLTYSVNAGYQRANYYGLDGIIVLFTADPAKAAEAAKVAKDTVVAFAKEGPTDDEIKATEAQFANVMGAQIQRPEFWVQALQYLYANGHTVDQIASRLERIMTVDREALKAVLAKVVADPRFVQVIAKPK